MELERDPLKHAHARLFDSRARLTHEIALGEEMGPERCMSAGCERLRVAHSIKCKKHLYEMVHGHACPFDGFGVPSTSVTSASAHLMTAYVPRTARGDADVVPTKAIDASAQSHVRPKDEEADGTGFYEKRASRISNTWQVK